jgi:tetratricopeptide (TPR) repeat protein
VKRARSRTGANPSRRGRSPSVNPQSHRLPAATGIAVEIRWAEIAELTNPQDRAEFIDRHADLVQPEVVSNLTALIPQLVKSDRHKALAVAETALLIAHRLGETECVALSLRARANAHYSLGQTKAALENHAQALRLFRSLGQCEQVARTLSSSIQPLILQGRYRQAYAAAREARKIFTQQQNQWRVARLDLNLGNILDRQDRFAKALECYKRAYRYLSVHGQDDPEAVGVALHNMAVLYTRRNDFRAAEATYEKARTFATAHDMPLLVGQADYNIAWLHYLRGDYSRAISMLREARKTCTAGGDEYHVALCYLDLSEIYLELNLIAEAAETAENASGRFSQLGMQYEKGKSLANLAVALSQQGEEARSLELFLEARQIFAQEKNKILPSVIDQYRALVLFSQERDTEARQLCTSALRVLQKFGLTNRAVVCHLLLARLCLRKNHPDQRALRAAQKHCARALKALKSLELPVLSCQAYALRGQIHAAAGNDRLSYTAYVRAKRYLDSLRNRIHTEELKISFMKDRVEIYEALVDLRLKRIHKTDVMSEIFGYVEQAKSRTLFDFLSVSRSPVLGPEGQNEHAKRIRELREELNWYFHQAELAQLKESSRHQVMALRAESHRRERELLKLSREHGPADEALAPDAAGVQLSTTYTPHRVREFLRPNVNILEYFQVRGRIIVLLLTQDRFQIVPLGEVSRISTLLDLLQFQLSKLRLGADYVKNFATVLLSACRIHLQDLYKLLIDPVRHLLTGDHLVIAPHGLLHQLPFQALFDGGQYLIDEFTLSYAPSASVYALCQSRKVRDEGSRHRGSLVLGIPDALVPFVRDEVEAVSGSLPQSEVLLGEKATAERLRQQGPHCRFIHIATHGYFRRDNPMFSGIRLGDSYLSLYDLYQLKLPAELVALSGCSTGLNVIAAGDELMGLARGLIHAGAETSMLTLWDVQDESTARLMKFFYSHLTRGRDKAVALQQAMLEVKSTDPHPYYWAPFVLVGTA